MELAIAITGIVALLVGTLTGFFISLKALQIGLRWGKQTDAGILPTMKNPIEKPQKPIIPPDIMREWLTGVVEDADKPK